MLAKQMRLYFLPLLLPLQLLAQGNIMGSVVSETSFVPFANIELERGKRFVTADSTGFFVFENVATGSYTITVHRAGFQNTRQQIEVSDGRTLKLSIHLQQLARSMQEVVISGAVKEMRKDELAIPVEIFARSYFSNSNAGNVYDAIRSISGIQANIDGAVDQAGDIEINGMEGTYTLILIDGVPLQGGIANQYALVGIPMNLVERIEVIKGPASTVYGTDAMAGVINIITVQPERAARFSVDAQLSSYLETRAELSGAFKVKKASSIIGASVLAINNKWNFNRDNFTDVPLRNSASLFNKWTWRNRYSKRSSVFARYAFEDKIGGQMNFTRSDVGSNMVYTEAVRVHRAEVLGNFAMPTKKQNLNLQTAYAEHHQTGNYGTTTVRQTERSGMVQLVYDDKVARISDLMIGAAYRFKWYDDNLTTTRDSSGNTAPIVNHFPSLFVQDMLQLDENHELLAGLRYEYNTLYKGNSISPRVDYKFTNDKRSDILRIGFSSGFRTPDIFLDERASFSGGKRIVVDGEIKTELAYGSHINYTRYANTNLAELSFDANLFGNYMLNVIEANYDEDPTAIILENDGTRAFNAGLTAALGVRFTFPLKLNLGFTVLQAYELEPEEDTLTGETETEFTPMKNAPVFNATWMATYEFRKAGVSIDFSGLLNSPMHMNVVPNDFRPETSPWYALLNIQVTKRFKCGVQIYAGVSNILNVRPRIPVLNWFDPFNTEADNPQRNPNGYRFDTSYIYAPNQGVKGFVGLRYLLVNAAER